MIENIDDIFWKDIDTLIIGHLDQITAVSTENIKVLLLKKCINNNINVYLFDVLNASQFVTAFKKRGLKISCPNIKKVEILEVAHMSRKIIKDGTQNVLLQYYYTEITNKNVDKWYALQDLVARLGIQENEIMAIGDNVNDKKMIENAGLGIAMGESAPYIKEVADEVTLDNDHDGVGVVIEKYV